ncbi:MAG: SgcJ/EcaC family oxidoreductase [Acidobacteriia bacterium]|nr:SgcJ/EcaC family oxidoreductase [Terriglobia bacterium]
MGLTVACQQPPPPSPPDTRAADERAIREADVAGSKAAAAKDVEAYVGLYAEDALVLPPNAPMQTGKEAIRKSTSETMASPGFALSFQPSKVEASRAGDLAYDVGTYQFAVNDAKGKPVSDRGKYVVVWKKQPDGKWKIVADIFNSDLAVPKAAKL